MEIKEGERSFSMKVVICSVIAIVLIIACLAAYYAVRKEEEELKIEIRY